MSIDFSRLVGRDVDAVITEILQLVYTDENDTDKVDAIKDFLGQLLLTDNDLFDNAFIYLDSNAYIEELSYKDLSLVFYLLGCWLGYVKGLGISNDELAG